MAADSFKDNNHTSHTIVTTSAAEVLVYLPAVPGPRSKTRPRKSVGSLDKKRERDRRAQQNLRTKRLERIQELEQRLVLLDDKVRKYGRILLDFDKLPLHPPAAVISEAESAAQTMMEFSRRSPEGTASLQPCLPTDSSIPRWKVTPYHEDGDVIMTDCFRLWLQRPDLVKASPESPAPLELLYGSKTNFLANVIHEAGRKWPCRDPERLAGGWLCYHFIKWMICPTQAAYSHLQPWQLPVQEQLQKKHPYFIDLLWWPGLRANMINKQHRYDLADAFALFTCCIKVRWAWGKNFLEPGEDGQFRILPEFYDTFTRIEGWGLTDELMTRYPAIVDGLDVDSIRFQVALE
ncbi:hypothetical protein NEMBOFW57_010597 [Staphylotrichum longicolle]|uniref:BZIP transcription factor n=1 Tax=Staphylotrichum longicolle TaxID=669026 RepID=A0AAD4EN18_9PEZI|nr:hypothetical protein NEMBOFW57_010597 [Staphylotrichum longicolle]